MTQQVAGRRCPSRQSESKAMVRFFVTEALVELVEHLGLDRDASSDASTLKARSGPRFHRHRRTDARSRRVKFTL